MNRKFKLFVRQIKQFFTNREFHRVAEFLVQWSSCWISDELCVTIVFSLSWDSWSRFWIHNFYIMIWNFHYLKAIESLCSTPSLARNVIQFSCSFILHGQRTIPYVLSVHPPPSCSLFICLQYSYTYLLPTSTSSPLSYLYFSMIHYCQQWQSAERVNIFQLIFPSPPPPAPPLSLSHFRASQHRVNGVDTARWLDSGSWSFQSPRWSIGFIVESWLDSWALLSELMKSNLITAVFRYFGNLQRQNLDTDFVVQGIQFRILYYC